MFCFDILMFQVPRIKEGKDLLDKWCVNSSNVVHSAVNIFGESMDPSSDPVLEALMKESDNPMLTDILGRLLKAIRSVYERQLSRYLDPADLAEPSKQQLLAASSAPSHNMQGGHQARESRAAREKPGKIDKNGLYRESPGKRSQKGANAREKPGRTIIIPQNL